MMDEETRANEAIIPEHESSVRRMMADAHRRPYHPLRSLAEAQAVPDGVVIFEGDWGGQIYATCPASIVRCSKETLRDLLCDLDAVGWCELDGARVFYERHPSGTSVSGGMGGGRVTDDLWVHPRIKALGLSAPLRAALTNI